MNRNSSVPPQKSALALYIIDIKILRKFWGKFEVSVFIEDLRKFLELLLENSQKIWQI